MPLSLCFAIMDKIQLTITQKRFLERFDQYTNQGAEPRKTKDLRVSWKMQDRTINRCYRLGLLKKVDATGSEALFVVNPQCREALGLATKCFEGRMIRKRSSAM